MPEFEHPHSSYHLYAYTGTSYCLDCPHNHQGTMTITIRRQENLRYLAQLIRGER